MAIYYLGAKSFGRSAGTGGSVSTSAAAYRSGERIRDERTGRVYDHSNRHDIDHKEILLPAKASKAATLSSWAKDRSELWNMVERSEPRANSRVAREYIVALPHELNAERRVLLARTFAREISDRYNNVVDLTVHQGRTDPRNFHAHLLTTTREIMGSGLGPKTFAELNDSQRFEQGLPRAEQEHTQIRERWAAMTNEALREAGMKIRISHVPDAESILQPGARPWLPRVAWEIERRGGHSVVGDRVREQFAQRREAALAVEAARRQSTPEIGSGSPKNPDEIAKQAAQNWLAYRAETLRRESGAAPNAPGLSTDGLQRHADIERQVMSLHRELGRDGYGL